MNEKGLSMNRLKINKIHHREMTIELLHLIYYCIGVHRLVKARSNSFTLFLSLSVSSMSQKLNKKFSSIDNDGFRVRRICRTRVGSPLIYIVHFLSLFFYSDCWSRQLKIYLMNFFMTSLLISMVLLFTKLFPNWIIVLMIWFRFKH